MSFNYNAQTFMFLNFCEENIYIYRENDSVYLTKNIYFTTPTIIFAP